MQPSEQSGALFRPLSLVHRNAAYEVWHAVSPAGRPALLVGLPTAIAGYKPARDAFAAAVDWALRGPYATIEVLGHDGHGAVPWIAILPEARVVSANAFVQYLVTIEPPTQAMAAPSVGSATVAPFTTAPASAAPFTTAPPGPPVAAAPGVASAPVAPAQWPGSAQPPMTQQQPHMTQQPPPPAMQQQPPMTQQPPPPAMQPPPPAMQQQPQPPMAQPPGPQVQPAQAPGVPMQMPHWPAAVQAPPVSMPSVSAPPMSGAPMSGPFVSAPPMSGPPMSGPPMSGPPMSGPSVSAPPMSGSPMSAPPMSGTSGAPTSGPPMSATPMSSPPMSGPPMSGPPMSSPPMSGPPMSSPPMSSPPMSGPPMSGPPMSGPPMSGPPMSGPPMSGPPVSAQPMSGSSASGPPSPAVSGPAGDAGVWPAVEPGPVAPWAPPREPSGWTQVSTPVEQPVADTSASVSPAPPAPETVQAVYVPGNPGARQAPAATSWPSWDQPGPVAGDEVAPAVPPLPQPGEWPSQQQGRRGAGRTVAYVAAALVLLLIIGGGVTWLVLNNGKDTPNAAPPTGAASPSPSPSPVPKFPVFQQAAAPVSVIGGTWQAGEQTAMRNFQDWPFAFRTAADTTCEFWVGEKDYKAYNCTRGVAPAHTVMAIVVRRCPDQCGESAQAELEAKTPWKPDVTLTTKDPVTRFGDVDYGDGREQYTMVHYFGESAGAPLQWVVIFQGNSTVQDRELMFKTANDIRSQTP